MTNQASFDTMFTNAEILRIAGQSEPAIARYTEIDQLSLAVTEEQLISLHHMWGVALLDLRETEEARAHFRKATNQRPDNRKWAAIDRDYSRSYLIDGQLGQALHHIAKSVEYIPHSDLAERGASLGFTARILTAEALDYVSHPDAKFLLGDSARLKALDALELFGTADALLARSENRHYELYNLIHFVEAVIALRDIYDGDDGERRFVQAQVPRLIVLADSYGGPPHRHRARTIRDAAFADARV